MATVADLIRDALEDLGVLASGETPTAAEEASAFRRLNRMLDTWAAEGLEVSTFVATTDTIDLPPGYEEAILLGLSLKLAPGFGVQPSQELMGGAAEAKLIIKRTEHAADYMSADPAVLTPGATDLTTLE